MKKIHIFLIVFAVILFIWFLINSEEISEMNEVHKISHQKSVGMVISEEQNTKLENYIKDIYEIKLRGCTFGAKILSIKCTFTDNVSKYALGRYDDYISSEVFKEKHKLNKLKPLFTEE